MELRNLRSFVLVADTSSFSVAATRCYLTQSAVSQHIKALEEELKCKLLIRNSHNITLTECGEALFEQAKEILKLSDGCIEQINALKIRNKNKKGLLSSRIPDPKQKKPFLLL